MDHPSILSTESSSNKRPRSPTIDQSVKAPRLQSLQINYLARQHQETIPLITVNEKLPELLRLVGEYDGVLQRHESMAGNLGACPLGPILLKRFERLFDGPPRILKSHARDANVSWLDVVEFAQNKPEQFNLEKMRNGIRVCQFYTKQCRVEISEEDFVLIHSGMPQKLIPPQPILEDEEKELGVMDLLDRNLGQVIQLADQVSARARQLIHKMKGRRSAIISRRESEGEARRAPLRSNDSPMSPAEPNGTASRPIRSIEPSQSPPMGFTAVNVRQSVANESDKRGGDVHKQSSTTDDLFSGPSTGNVTYINGRSIKGASPTERAELMKKFMTTAERDVGSSSEHIRRPSLSGPKALSAHGSSETRPRSDSTEQLSNNLLNKPTSTVAIPHTPASLMPQAKAQIIDRDDGGPFKTEMVSRMESMRRGERVIPPCDRCRRLHMDCLKNLTACMGCTKKHAKCSWKDVMPEELHGLERLWDSENQGHREAERLSATPPSTVAEVSRAIEERRQPDNGVPARSEPSPSEEDTVMKDSNFQETPPPRPKDDEPAPRSPPAGPTQAALPPAPAPAPVPAPTAAPVTKAESPPRPPSTGKFDVRPPPLGQQLLDAANRRSPPHAVPNYPTYAQKETMRRRSLEQDENDEGDRLQALAAQVYRSASQSVKPQESS